MIYQTKRFLESLDRRTERMRRCLLIVSDIAWAGVVYRSHAADDEFNTGFQNFQAGPDLYQRALRKPRIRSGEPFWYLGSCGVERIHGGRESRRACGFRHGRWSRGRDG